MSKKKRPGVQAGIHLVSLTTAAATDEEGSQQQVLSEVTRGTWRRVEEHHDKLIAEMAVGLDELDRGMQNLKSKEFLTKDDMDLVLDWKFKMGKSREFNRKLLHTNTDQAVQTHSREAVALARQTNVMEAVLQQPNIGTLTDTGQAAVQQAIQELTQLKGVGPATASAVLAFIRPELFCFMYDEVIDCFQSVRDYKLSTYMAVNNQCLKIAHLLNTNTDNNDKDKDNNDKYWTTQRVAKTLWTASRYMALYSQDLTLLDDDNAGKDTSCDTATGEATAKPKHAREIKAATTPTTADGTISKPAKRRRRK